MYMRITWGRLKQGHWDAFKADYERLTAGRTIPGLKTRYLVRDSSGSDAGYSITIWEDEAALKANLENPQREQMRQQMLEHFTGEYTVTAGPVELAAT